MKLTIFKRLTFGYAIILLLVIFLGIYLTFKMTRLNQLIYEISSIHNATIRIAEHIVANYSTQVRFEKKFTVAGDQDFLKRSKELEIAIVGDLNRLLRLSIDPDRRSQLKKLKKIYELHLSHVTMKGFMTQEAGKHRQNDPNPGLVEGEAIIEDVYSGLQGLIRGARTDREAKTQLSSEIGKDVFKMASITVGLIIFCGLLISYFNTKSINRSISELRKKTREIAKGKFLEITGIHTPPEIADLAMDFNDMSKRLKKLDQLKSDFLSHMSHELRTPLTAIREASLMLLEGLYSGSLDKERELLMIISEECERQIRLVNRILDLSRLEGEMMDYRFHQCSIEPIIRNTIMKLRPIAESKQIVFEMKPLPELPLVNMDEERIEQVLENLVANALKFTPEKGVVKIYASHRNDRDEKEIHVAVSDTGCGLASEELEIIFDKFRRTYSGKQDKLGTGLGLSIAKHIISAHGGRIWAQSQPQKGSTFFFALPVS